MNLTDELTKDAKTAIVILVQTKNDRVRFFHDFKDDRIINSWSLAGAKLFLSDNLELKVIEDFLRENGYKFERQTVCLFNQKNNYEIH